MPSGAFNSDFEPVARPGDAIRLQGRETVRAVEAYNVLPSITLDSPVTVADATSETVEIEELEMPDLYLAQVRLPNLGTELPDGVTITVDHNARQNPMYETSNERGVLDNNVSGYGDGHPFTELFVYQDNPPYFTIRNASGGQVNIDLTFVGYVFELGAEVGAGKPVSVPVSALRR